jgi:hypothetical protein
MAYSIKAQELLSRISPRLGADIRNEVSLALGIANTVRENVAKITADKRYSPEGNRDQIKQMLGKGPFGHLDQIRSKLTKPLESLQADRAKFTIKADRTDMFGEMQRQEARTWLRSLPDIERIRAVLESKDDVIREAVALAPSQLSGVNADIKQTVFDGLLAARFGDAIAKNAELIEGLEYAPTVVAEAGNDIRREAGLSDRDMAELRAA